MRPLLISLAAAFLSTSALAAPATQAGADGLIATFQTYLGTTPGVVSVAPEGDHYGVKLDLAVLATRLPADTAEITATPVEFQLTDNGDGTWGVAQDQPFALTFRVPGQIDASYDIGSMKMQGVFDATLGGFTAATSDLEDLSSKQVMTVDGQEEQNTTMHLDAMHSEVTGTASAAKGGIDQHQVLTMTGFRELIIFKPPGEDAPVELSVAAASGQADATIRNLRSDAVLRLIAFFVANPSKAAITEKQADMKALLAAGVPLWDHIGMDETLSALTVDTPFGGGTADAVGVKFDLNGLVPEGLVREAFSVTGLKLSEGLVPGWATTLVPTGFSMDFKLSRFDAAAPVSLILGALDLAKEPPLPEGKEAEIMAALLPEGLVDLTIAPGGIDGPAYRLGYEGGMSFGPATRIPTGKGKLTLTGVDAILEALKQAPPEIGGQASMAIGMARGAASPGPAGEPVWELESDGTGRFLVNGADLAAMAGGQ